MFNVGDEIASVAWVCDPSLTRNDSVGKSQQIFVIFRNSSTDSKKTLTAKARSHKEDLKVPFMVSSCLSLQPIGPRV